MMIFTGIFSHMREGCSELTNTGGVALRFVFERSFDLRGCGNVYIGHYDMF